MNAFTSPSSKSNRYQTLAVFRYHTVNRLPATMVRRSMVSLIVIADFPLRRQGRHPNREDTQHWSASVGRSSNMRNERSCCNVRLET